MAKLEKIIWNTKSPFAPDGRVSMQRLRDKLGHNHAWSVNSSRVNWDKQQFEFDLEKGVTEVISFKAAWDEFGWDDVNFVDKEMPNEGVIPVAKFDDGTCM